MKRILSFAALALLAASPLRAQMAQPANLPPIPDVRAYEHWGQIERDYDDDEASTSVSLSLPFDAHQRDAFVRHGNPTRVELSAGFVFAGRTMTRYPDLVTMLMKVARPADEALRGDRVGSGDITFTIAGDKPVTVAAPLVSRMAADAQSARSRNVEDTYVVVLSLPQFLRIVDGARVSAQLRDMKFEFTGGPLEALRDLASRIDVAP